MAERFTQQERKELEKILGKNRVDTVDYLDAKFYLNALKEYDTTRSQKSLSSLGASKRNLVEQTPSGALGAGMLRTFGETITGLPDLVTEGVNWLSKKAGTDYQAPTMGSLFRQATGQAEGPKAEEVSSYYAAPGYVAAAVGVTQLGMLAKEGWKAFKDKRLMKKADELLGELDPQTRNMFSNWMVRGQGSSSPEVAAMIEKVRNSPKYGELFAAMEKQAGEAALKGIKPRPSVQTPEEAAAGIAKTIQDKLQRVKTDRATAGNEAFAKAFNQVGDSAFVETTNTRAAINGLRKQFPDNKAVQAYLTELEGKLVPSFQTPAIKATPYVVRSGEAPRTIPGAAPRMETRTRTVVEYDSIGMPKTREITESFPVEGSAPVSIKGTPEVRGVITGREGFTVTQKPVKLTIERLQGFLHDFGKKAEGSDSVVTGLSLDDMKKVNSALFSGLKTDLADTVKTATNVSEKKAAGYLIQAREQFRKASEKYDNMIAQGVPKWLQGKAVNEITIEDLTKAYKETNPAQRQMFRDWVGDTRAESLQAIDKAVFDDFLKGTYQKLPDGTFGYDLGALADKWQQLQKTDPNVAGQITDALGVNATEFSKRMKDASVFTRKIQRGASKSSEEIVPGNIKSDIAAAVGATPASYRGAKIAQLSIDAVNQLFKKRGLSEEQLMKVLLTPEGKDFLSNAALSPQSAKTLESLIKVEQPASFSLPAFSAAAAPAAPAMDEATTEPMQWELPPELSPQAEQSQPAQQWELPPELK